MMNTEVTDPLPSAPPAAKTSGIAIVSFILGLSTFVFSILTGIPALICGHVALSKIKKSTERLNGKGLAVTGLVLGYLSFIGVFVVAGFVALLAPAFTTGVHSGKNKAHAALAAHNVKDAISVYFTEYRKYPVPDMETMEDGYLTDETIMNVLVSGPTDLNPRKIIFFSGRAAEPLEGDESGKFVNGLSVEEGNTKLWDPWGNLFRIGLDLNNDGMVKGPDGIDVRQSVIVWSPGPDGADGTADDARTW